MVDIGCPVDSSVDIRSLGVRVKAVIDGDWIVPIKIFPAMTVGALKNAIAKKVNRILEKIALEENPGDE